VIHGERPAPLFPKRARPSRLPPVPPSAAERAMRLRPLLAAAIALSLSPGCGRKGSDGEARLFSQEDARAAAAVRFDPERPEGSIVLGADEAARRIGSFEWTAGAEWTVSRQGTAERVHAIERHRLVQGANGEFQVETEIDPGLGEGARTGRDVIWAGSMTYARGRWAPWRERPTDHGRDARRYRGESFGLAADLAALLGPKLSIAAAGDATLLGRAALKYTLALAGDVPEAAPAPETRVFAQGGPDADTKVRLSLLDGAQPLTARGELFLDAQTGVPLRLSLDAAFGVKADPRARAQVALRAQVKTLGAGVPAVSAPKDPLPDERKPRGIADALERAGLRKKAEGEKAGGEPGEDAEP